MRKNSEQQEYQLGKVATHYDSRDSFTNQPTGYLPPESGSAYSDITPEGMGKRNSEEHRYLTKKLEKLDSSISRFSKYFSIWIYTLMVFSIMEVKNRNDTQQQTFSGKWAFGDISLTFLAGLYVLSAFTNKMVPHSTIACFLFSIQIFVKAKIYINDDPKLLYPFFIGCFDKIGIDFVKNFRYFAILMGLIHIFVTINGTWKVRSLLKQRHILQKEINIDNNASLLTNDHL